MKPDTASLVAVAIVLLTLGVSAQWPPYPTPNVPRTAAGQPNLDAPAPRTADGRPDLTGVWQYVRRDGLPPAQTGPDLLPLPGTNQFWDIATGLKEPIPFTPAGAALRRQRMADHSKDNPDAHCLPLGVVQLHTHPDPRRIVQTPRLIVMLWEANGSVRQIFTDGRPLPRNDPQPWYLGYSVGTWEGETLVVETAGLRDDGWLDVYGTPLTSAGRVTERFRRITFGTLDIDVTIDDPTAYTKPWTANIRHRLMLDTELMEFVCQENEKSSRYF